MTWNTAGSRTSRAWLKSNTASCGATRGDPVSREPSAKGPAGGAAPPAPRLRLVSGGPLRRTPLPGGSKPPRLRMLELLAPAPRTRFSESLAAPAGARPIEARPRAWSARAGGREVLVMAPTGSEKILADLSWPPHRRRPAPPGGRQT